MADATMPLGSTSPMMALLFAWTTTMCVGQPRNGKVIPLAVILVGLCGPAAAAKQVGDETALSAAPPAGIAAETPSRSRSWRRLDECEDGSNDKVKEDTENQFASCTAVKNAGLCTDADKKEGACELCCESCGSACGGGDEEDEEEEAPPLFATSDAGACPLTDGGACATSRNFGNQSSNNGKYQPGDHCTLTMLKSGRVSGSNIDLHGCQNCIRSPFVQMPSDLVSGGVNVLKGGTISWVSEQQSSPGQWKLCLAPLNSTTCTLPSGATGSLPSINSFGTVHKAAGCCADGTDWNFANGSACQLCAPGKHDHDADVLTACAACPPGRWNNATGGVGSDACRACPADSTNTTPPLGASSPTQCGFCLGDVHCSPGSFCHGGGSAPSADGRTAGQCKRCGSSDGCGCTDPLAPNFNNSTLTREDGSCNYTSLCVRRRLQSSCEDLSANCAAVKSAGYCVLACKICCKTCGCSAPEVYSRAWNCSVAVPSACEAVGGGCAPSQFTAMGRKEYAQNAKVVWKWGNSTKLVHRGTVRVFPSWCRH